ncbi:DUF2058 domain-containing protein [Endozoicomonas sp. 4G]|uniref:DUF2058 domain-containing protein n=1 Tax=Endozoicomonas sp. 4G TaxID=2872754 RepID=UPI002078F610|nr:DUF2058 domain-containing protein [Endozoicomonas sp. 4G]
MSKSLRDQLMGAGLATKQQALKAKTSNKKKKKQAARSGELTDQEKRRIELEKQKAEQVERDRQLNRKLEEERQQKALAAQVCQLIEMNSIPREAGDVGYNFVVGDKVKKIYVSEDMQNRLSRGLFAIGILSQGDEEEYRVIPATVARKIEEREPAAVVVQSESQSELTEEEQEWYADYEIPDDLMW